MRVCGLEVSPNDAMARNWRAQCRPLQVLMSTNGRTESACPIPNPEIPQKLSLSSLIQVFQFLDHTRELRDERVLRTSLRKRTHKLSVIPELLFLAHGETHPEVFLMPPVIRKN